MMLHRVERNSSPNRVTALFGYHEQSFDLFEGMTLAQLAERVVDLAWETEDSPVSVSVVFAGELPARAIVSSLPTRRRSLVGLVG